MYNGWSNYETWCVALWLDNEESTYREVRRLARNAEEDHDTPDERAAELAGNISAMVEEQAPELGANVFSDLLNAALSEVDYFEIARHVLSE